MVVREEGNFYNKNDDNKDFFEDDKDFDFLNDNEIIKEEPFIKDINIPIYKTSVFRRYSIFEDKEKIYILDHRKAEEKIKMNEFIKDFKNSKVSSQLILNPIKVNLNKLDIDKFNSKKDLFKKLGFDIELLSDSSLLIREIPTIFDIPEDNNFFYEILDIDNNLNDEILTKRLRSLVKNLSFRKGHDINKKEAEELYKKLMNEDNPYKTYDGKATIISLVDKDLEKYFER